MAEYGAHITITTRERPSIFDVVAQEGLMSSLQPALAHVVKVLAESNPEKYAWLMSYNDEFFLFFNAIIQHHYLSHYGSSFAENFYDLKRVPLQKSSDHPSLSLPKSIHIKSLLALSAIPYVVEKIETAYQRSREEGNGEQLQNERWINKIKHVLFKVWPVLHLSWETLKLICYIRYMIGGSKYHSVLLPVCGIYLATLSDEDYDLIDERAKNMLSLKSIRTIKDLCLWAVERVGSSLINTLEVGAFFLQFLDWFYSSSEAPRSLTRKPVPPPPQESQTGRREVDKHLCPICLQPRKQEAVISASGYVFCYACALRHLRHTKRCPVTNYPATTMHLIKIYQQV